MGCTNGRYNNYNRKLRELHCLVEEFIQDNEDVSNRLDEDNQELIQVFCDLKCTVKDQQNVLESYLRIMDWLDKNASCYSSNVNSCECERLNKEVEKILKTITRELVCSLSDITKAIKTIENAQCLQVKLDRAFARYIECIHEDDNSCGF